eukprot:1962645-Amphidinium_carterae.2
MRATCCLHTYSGSPQQRRRPNLDVDALGTITGTRLGSSSVLRHHPCPLNVERCGCVQLAKDMCDVSAVGALHCLSDI